MQNKMKKVVDLIISKDDKKAKNLLKNIIQKNPRYISYKKQLAEMGLDLRIATIPEKVYEDIENVIASYHPAARLRILDETYLRVSKNNLYV